MSPTPTCPIWRSWRLISPLRAATPASGHYWFRKLNELSKTEPENPTVLASLGAVEMAQVKDNAKAAHDFALAIKNGSEEPITFLNLATALENLGRGQQAEGVLERGVAAYPYNDQLMARLAQQYVQNSEAEKARKLVEQYRAVFPEDSLVREAADHLDSSAGPDPSTLPAKLTRSPRGKASTIQSPRNC